MYKGISNQWVVSRVLSRYIVTKRLRCTAVVLFDWVVFQLRKRKKYASLFLLDRLDSILQISHILNYVLDPVINISGLIALAAGSFYVI